MSGIKPQNGITAETYKRLATDAGVVFANYGEVDEMVLGATRGGNTFTIEDDNREMTVDGAPGAVKGSFRRVRTTATLSVNLLEITTSSLKMQLPGAESVDGVQGTDTHDTITRSTQISAGDYYKNITLLVAKNGTSEPFMFKLKNAIALDGLEFGASDDDETVTSVEFTATFDPADLATEPWEISNPVEA